MAVLPLDIKENDRILIIAPHPDDECIGCGGLIATYSNQIDILVVTDGRLGNGGIDPEKEAKIRYSQFQKEMQIANVNASYWLGYYDGELSKYDDCYNGFDITKYTKIFVPGLKDNHPDHTFSNFFMVPKVVHEEVNVEMYEYEVHEPLNNVTAYLDISEVIEKKRCLIQCHKDQLRNIRYDVVTEALNRYRACQFGAINGYYEAYSQIYFKDIRMSESVEREKTLQKYQLFYRILLMWLNLKLKNKSIGKILALKGIRKVSIYGYASLGRALELDLKDDLIVVDILDKRRILINDTGKRTTYPEDGDRSVDLVLVTVSCEFEKIKDQLQRLDYNSIISIQEILENEKGMII